MMKIESQKLLGILMGVLLILPSLGSARSLPDFTELVEENSPAVVNISTRQKKKGVSSMIPKGFNLPQIPEGTPFDDLLKRFFDHPQINPDHGGKGKGLEREAQSLGSGFIIDADGYVVTNNHVIEDAEQILVRLSDRRELEAKVIGTDKRSDLALLKIDADDLPVVKMGSSKDLKVGEWVMAIGSPFGFDHSVSVGVVSALGRNLPSENYVPFIQTDVAINPGNSGGPLFNLDGEVVGINSQIYSRTGGFMGLSFAIPVDVMQNVVSQLRDQGAVTRGWLGVLIQDVTRDLAESFDMERPMGALVAQVVENSPASEAGLKVGDIILEYEDRPVETSSSLPPMVGQTEVGKSATLKVLRQAEEIEVEITIGALPNEPQLAQSRMQKKGDIQSMGIIVDELDNERRQQMKQGGVVVREVAAESAAQRAGIRVEDILVELNNQKVTNIEQLQNLVEELPRDRSVPVLIIRNGSPRFLALRIGEK